MGGQNVNYFVMSSSKCLPWLYIEFAVEEYIHTKKMVPKK